MKLGDSISTLPGVGTSYAQKLSRLGIETIEDLLLHAPHRYRDLSRETKIHALLAGEAVTITGQVVFFKNAYTKSGKRIQLATIADDTGKVDAMWFNNRWLARQIPEGSLVSLSGKVSFYKKKLTLFSPDYEKIGGGERIHTAGIIPIYPETAGVSSKWLRRLVHRTIERINLEDDHLSSEIKSRHGLLDIKEAFVGLHKPESEEHAEMSRLRFAFEELLALHTINYGKMIDWQKEQNATPLKIATRDLNKFINSLPFALTKGQKSAINEVLSDMSTSQAMNRLLEGDVGSGKTVVAAAAAYCAYRSGKQALVMAPTQILASQHQATFKDIFGPFDARIALITGSNKDTGYGRPDIVIGTHALINHYDKFPDVAVVVIDEQHRFGVKQRAKLSKMPNTPHTLTMTATPIPRTIALTLYGDLDVSSITELPKGRKKITTWIVPPVKREGAYQWIDEQIEKASTQVYVVCPLIEESKAEIFDDVKAATVEYEKLLGIFPGRKIGLLHGKMSPREKDKVILAFKNKKFDILVSTPVVEVGIDVPNATIMMVEGAERFGLSQLYQLRGRVGRGEQKSYCLMMTEKKSPKAYRRLDAITTAKNGKELAELDLEMRGPGEIFGIRQHGIPELKFARWDDLGLIQKTREVAREVITAPKENAAFLQNIKHKQSSPN